MLCLLHLQMKHRKENLLLNLAELKGFKRPSINKEKAHFVKFTAETRSSGIDMRRWNKQIRKGAFDAIKQYELKKQAIHSRS